MIYEHATPEELLKFHGTLQKKSDVRQEKINKLYQDKGSMGDEMEAIEAELERRAKLVRVAEQRIEDERVRALASDLAKLLREATALKAETRDNTVGRVLSTVLFSAEGFELLSDGRWSHSTADCEHNQSIDIGNHRDYIIDLNNLDFFIEGDE